jgi:hypothetical protein
MQGRGILRLEGRVKVWRNGQLLHSGRNLIVTDGLELLAQLIGSSATKPSHMAMGGDSAQPTDSQSDLQGSEFERVTISTSVSGREVSYSASFGSGLSSTQTIREFGIFNDASAGTMLARFVTPRIKLQPGESLDVDWTLVVGGN